MAAENGPPDDHAEFEELRELSRGVYAEFASEREIGPPSEDHREFDAIIRWSLDRMGERMKRRRKGLR